MKNIPCGVVGPSDEANGRAMRKSSKILLEHIFGRL